MFLAQLQLPAEGRSGDTIHVTDNKLHDPKYLDDRKL